MTVLVRGRGQSGDEGHEVSASKLGDAAVKPASLYRSDIDGLRAIAVLGVLFYHAGLSTFQGGFLGVDVFFVISGYLITKLIRDAAGAGTFTYAGFYARRARRLFPALAVTLLATFAVAYKVFPPDYLQQFGASAAAAIVGFSNIFFWSIGGYFDTTALTKPALHTWSLGVEEQFYFLWPVVLVTTLRYFRDKTAFAVIACIGVASLILNAVFLLYGGKFAADAPSLMFYWLPFRAYELALGAAIVWAERFRPTSRMVLEALALLGLLATVIPIFALNDTSPMPALVPCFGAALLIFVGKGQLAKVVFDNRPAVWIGKISYSLYLVHWPIAVFTFYLLGDVTIGAKYRMCMASIVVAAGLYYTVERPLHFGAYLSGNRRFFAAAITAALVVIGLGTDAWRSGGWLWRYSPEIAALLSPASLGSGLKENENHCFLDINEPPAALDEACSSKTERRTSSLSATVPRDRCTRAFVPSLETNTGYFNGPPQAARQHWTSMSRHG